MLNDLLRYGFLRNALLAVVVGSALAGLVSPIVVFKRMEFIGDGLAHAIFAGVAAAVLLEFSVTLGGILATVAFATSIHVLSKEARFTESSAIGALLPVFMSVGIVLFSKSPRYTADVTSYLFGNVLTVTTVDIAFASATLIIASILILKVHYEISYWIFDEEMARFYSVKIDTLRITVLLLVSFTVVSILKIAGVVVMGAFLVMPGAFAKLGSRGFGRSVCTSVSFSILTSLIGFLIAYYLDLPPGPAIVLLSFAALSVYALATRKSPFVARSGRLR